MKISNLLEKSMIIIMFFTLLYTGYSNISDHKLQHDFPYGYLASDAFQHQVRAESIKEAGNFRYEAPYISMGLEKVVGRYPPIIYHLSVILSYASGLETYDSIYFIVFLFTSLSAILMYLIIRKLNKNIAILSFPLMLLLFAFRSFGGFTWGHWPSILSQFFLICFFWSIYEIDLKKSYLLIGIFAAAITLTHTSEMIFGIIAIIILLIFKFFYKKLKRRHIRILLIAAVITLIISFYYLIIFQNTWAVEQTYSFNSMPVWEGNNPSLYLSDFGVILLIILGIGFIFSLFLLKNSSTAIIFGISMLLMGYTNYIGFHTRAFQIRFLWPIYLSVFLGISLYQLSKFAIKKTNIIHSILISALFLIFFLGIIKVPSIPHYEKPNFQSGLMNPYHWDTLKWLAENTEKNSTVYFLFEGIYDQDALLRNSKRVHYIGNKQDFIEALNSRKIKRYYLTESPGDGGGSLGYRKSFFNYGNYAKDKGSKFFLDIRDLCDFDYIVVDKVSTFNQELTKYNLLIASELLKNDFISMAYNNQVSIILKNSKPGEDCIEPRNI